MMSASASQNRSEVVLDVVECEVVLFAVFLLVFFGFKVTYFRKVFNKFVIQFIVVRVCAVKPVVVINSVHLFAFLFDLSIHSSQ